MKESSEAPRWRTIVPVSSEYSILYEFPAQSKFTMKQCVIINISNKDNKYTPIHNFIPSWVIYVWIFTGEEKFHITSLFISHIVKVIMVMLFTAPWENISMLIITGLQVIKLPLQICLMINDDDDDDYGLVYVFLQYD